MLVTGGEQDTPVEELFPDERSENLLDQVIEQQETKRLIREIIEELSEDQHAAIGMFYYEEMSVKEIAAAMGSLRAQSRAGWLGALKIVLIALAAIAVVGLGVLGVTRIDSRFA